MSTTGSLGGGGVENVTLRLFETAGSATLVAVMLTAEEAGTDMGAL
jgi:hypothetical protein